MANGPHRSWVPVALSLEDLRTIAVDEGWDGKPTEAVIERWTRKTICAKLKERRIERKQEAGHGT